MAETKGAGSQRPRPAATKKAPDEKPKAASADEVDHPGPPIGIEPDIRVGGHVITDDGWTPEKGS